MIHRLSKYIVALSALFAICCCSHTKAHKASMELVQTDIPEDIAQIIHRGDSIREVGDPYSASFIHMDALLKAEEIPDTSAIVYAQCALGRDCRVMGQTNEAIEWYSDALSITNTIEDFDLHRNLKLEITRNIGTLLMLLEMDDSALEMLNSALEEARILNDKVSYAETAYNIAIIHERNKRYDQAKDMYREAIESGESSGADYISGRCHNRFGNMAEAEGQTELAIREYRTAYDILRSEGKIYTIDPCLDLTRLYISIGRRELASSYLTEAETIARKSNSSFQMSRVTAIMADYYENEGDLKTALEYLKEHLSLRDIVDGVNNKVEAERLKNKYAELSYNSALEIINNQRYKQAHRASRARFLIFVILISALLITIMLIYMLNMKTRANSTMKRLEDARQNFFTNVTHELRTPLTIILGMAKTLRMKVTGKAELEEDVDAVIDQGEYLLDMVNKLLDIAKVRSSIGEPQWKSGDIDMFLKMETETLCLLGQQHHISVEYASSTGSLTMDFVPSYVKKAFGNLVSNAIKYTRRSGHVLAELKLDPDDTVVISVTDDGEGIPEEELEHIFKAFYQGSRSGRANGSGIGLAVTYELVSSMGGSISVVSNAYEGTRFTIKMPRYHKGGKYTQWTPKPDVADKSGPGAANHKQDATILVVEDNSDIAKYEGGILEEHYSVIYARNGEEGLDMAKEYIPDIIVSDMMMPAMDGYEMCRRIRSSIEINHIPFIAVSAKCQEDDRIEALKCGVSYFIAKPFNPDELTTVVANALSRRESTGKDYVKAMHDGNEETVVENIPEKDKEFLGSLNSAISDNMSDPEFSADVLAKLLCLSQRQLGRKVKAITGLDTTTFIRKARMSTARKLITTTSLPIGEIVGKCGFYSSSYFSKLYRQEYGETPSSTRKNP